MTLQALHLTLKANSVEKLSILRAKLLDLKWIASGQLQLKKYYTPGEKLEDNHTTGVLLRVLSNTNIHDSKKSIEPQQATIAY